MPIDNLADDYPHIHELHSAVAGPWGCMEQLYDDANMSLPELNTALAGVGTPQGAVLQALSRDLFSDDLGKVLAAICEFLAFGWLTGHAGLSQSDIGFPADWRGDDPPFEGVLRSRGAEIAFDVKDGSGSGAELLRRLLQRHVDAQTRNGAAPPQVHVALNAPTGQRWVQENFRQIIGPFRQEIMTNGIGARTMRYEAGSGYVRIGIDSRVGASMMGMSEKASFVSQQMLDHALHKAERLHLTTAASFFLVYVRRRGSGMSDFADETVRAAADFLVGRTDLPSTLAGLLFLDFDLDYGVPAPRALCWDRSGTLAEWLGDGIQTYEPVAIAMPQARIAAARALNAADMESTTAIVAGSCDLRGGGCLASGSVGTVFAFHHRDEPYLACSSCRAEFGWPPPSC